MEFKQLQSYVAVVQNGGFTRAAERLYLSQPTISTHIRQIEEELHASLIIRTTKSIEVTPRGWDVYECAASILAQRNRLFQRCTGADMIHLGASTIPAAYIFPEVLPAYRKKHPETRFFLYQNDSQGIIESLLNGRLDIGLIGMKTAEPTLVCTPFYQDRMILITAANAHFRALKEQGGSLDALLQEPIILREEGSGSLKSADRIFESIGVTEEQLQIIARISDQETIRNLVAAGVGISILSQKAAQRDLAMGRLLMFPLPEPLCLRNLYLVYRANTIMPGHVKEFAHALETYYLQDV